MRGSKSAFVDFYGIVASRLSEAGLKTLLLEGGNQSYGVTGGDLDAISLLKVYHVPFNPARNDVQLPY